MKRLRNFRLATTLAVAAALCAAASGGCQSEADREAAAAGELSEDETARLLDTGLAMNFQDMAVENGVITEHTVYPHHFVSGGSALNELGQRDVSILAHHFLATEGADGASLNVRRGKSSEALYDKRVKAVTEELAPRGVERDAIRVADGLPGGDGVASQRIPLIVQRDYENKAYYEDDEGNPFKELIEKTGKAAAAATGGQ